jgi:hypothetical protein
MQIIDTHIHADFDSQWLKHLGYHHGVDFIRTIFPHKDDQKKVFYKNAIEFFKIKIC